MSVEQDIDSYIALMTELVLLRKENAQLKEEIVRLKWQLVEQD